jgi:hypothetical protein
MDEDILNEIRAQTDLESLRQCLYNLLLLSDENRALSTAIEYTHHKNLMIRRNAAIVLGKLTDKRAVPRLVEMIHEEFNGSRLYQYGDLSDQYGLTIDHSTVHDCINSIYSCSASSEDVKSLVQFTDKLQFYGVSESLVDEIRRLIEVSKVDSIPGNEQIIDLTIQSRELEKRLKKDFITQPIDSRQKKIVDPVDYYAIPGTQEYIRPSKPVIEPIKSVTLKSESTQESDNFFDDSQKVNNKPVIIGITLVGILVFIIIFLVITLSNHSVLPPQVTPTPYYVKPIVTSTPIPTSNQYGDLTGRVVTQNGKGIANAIITFPDIPKQGATSDKNGYYTLTQLLYGHNYRIYVWDSSYNNVICIKGITVNSQTTTLNLVQGTYDK